MRRPAVTPVEGRSVLRIGATRGVPSVLREFGENPAKLISEAGLDPKIFDDPDNRLSLHTRGTLILHCVKVTGCPHFGLLVGQRAGLDSLGLVGLLVKHSPDVETALRRLARDFHLHADGIAVDLTIEAGRAAFTYDICEPGVPGVDQTCDGALAVILNIMHELCGPDFKPTEAWFAHARPEDVGPYRKFFQVHLRFDAEINALFFSSTWLTRQLPATEPELSRLLQDKIEALERQNPRDFPDQVQRVMRTALAFDRVRAGQLAAMFSMHVRTFHRQLAIHGTSHQELLDRTRFAVACQLLEGSSRNLAAISDLLGYADTRSFNRAFRRWSGMTPACWRKERTITANVRPKAVDSPR